MKRSVREIKVITLNHTHFFLLGVLFLNLFSRQCGSFLRSVDSRSYHCQRNLEGKLRYLGLGPLCEATYLFNVFVKSTFNCSDFSG